MRVYLLVRGGPRPPHEANGMPWQAPRNQREISRDSNVNGTILVHAGTAVHHYVLDTNGTESAMMAAS